MGFLKGLLRRGLARLGYRVSRLGPSNRFQAMDDVLRHLRARGLRPSVIVDGGANMGQWARLASTAFPEARYHLVEPQPACRPVLDALVQERRLTAEVHVTAITEPGVASVRLIGGHGRGDTGAWVAEAADASDEEIECPATTLDALLLDSLGDADRVLLKLDLEGHEMPALRGAVGLLPRCEVLIVELPFYDIERRGHPPFADLLAHLGEAGFALYDFASLSPRPRDGRLRMGDAVFLAASSPLLEDCRWA